MSRFQPALRVLSFRQRVAIRELALTLKEHESAGLKGVVIRSRAAHERERVTLGRLIRSFMGDDVSLDADSARFLLSWDVPYPEHLLPDQ